MTMRGAVNDASLYDQADVEAGPKPSGGESMNHVPRAGDLSLFVNSPLRVLLGQLARFCGRKPSRIM